MDVCGDKRTLELGELEKKIPYTVKKNHDRAKLSLYYGQGVQWDVSPCRFPNM